MASEAGDTYTDEIADEETQDDGIVDEDTHDTERPPPGFLPVSTREAIRALSQGKIKIDHMNPQRESEILRKICADETVVKHDLVLSELEYDDRDKLVFIEYRYGSEIIFVYIDKDYEEPVSIQFDSGLRVSVKRPDVPTLFRVCNEPGHVEEVFCWAY